MKQETSELILEDEDGYTQYRRARHPRSRRESPAMYLRTPAQYNERSSIGNSPKAQKLLKGVFWALLAFNVTMCHLETAKSAQLENNAGLCYSPSGKLTNPVEHPAETAITASQKGVANNGTT